MRSGDRRPGRRSFCDRPAGRTLNQLKYGLPAGIDGDPDDDATIRNGRGSPAIEPPAALIAATVAAMSVTLRIDVSDRILHGVGVAVHDTIGMLRLALAASTVAPKFTKISGPPGTSMRLTSCMTNADW